jgi:uncharacterized protein YcnI
MQRTTRLTLGGLLAGLVSIVFLFAGVANAHVTVQPPEAEQGGFAKLTFRVPNERPDASTVGLRVQLPTDTPFAFVSVKPKQGWTYEAVETSLATPIEVEGETVTEAVSEISWTGGQIGPGQFDEFEVSVGPLPDDVDELFFPAIQIYDSGEEVAWIELPAADGAEPENPAPELTLVASSGDAHGGSDMAADASMTDGEDQAATTTTTDDDDSSNGLAIAALVVGGIAIVLSIIALASGRRQSAT